jgi:hypothetical protein
MKNRQEIIDQWKRNEFLAFLLIHIGNADLNFSREELMALDQLVDEQQFKQVEWVWSECNDFECLQVIRSLRDKLFPGDEGKAQLMELMRQQALLDHKLSTNEEIIIRSLRKLL